MNSQAATLSAATNTNTISNLNNATIPDNIAYVGVSGTYGTAVLAFQGSMDGTHWDDLVSVRCDTLGIETSPNMTDNDTRQWKVDVTGMQAFRVYCTSIVSGSITCQVNTTYAPGGISINLQNSLSGNQAISGTMAITSASANAFAVGPNGSTGPGLVVDASTSSAAAGLKITGAASGSGVSLAAIGGTNEALTLLAKGSGKTIVNNGTANTGAFQVGGAASGSNATGFTITPAAAASGLALAVISTGTDEALTINAKGAGAIGIGSVSTGTVTITPALICAAAVTSTGNFTVGSSKLVVTAATGVVTLASGANFVIDGATSGTKFGTATTQKISFWNATPVVQPAANADVTTGAAGGTTSVYLNTTFVGASGTAAYTLGGVVTALKAIGLLAP